MLHADLLILVDLITLTIWGLLLNDSYFLTLLVGSVSILTQPTQLAAHRRQSKGGREVIKLVVR
jgi:hypothetical protein